MSSGGVSQKKLLLGGCAAVVVSAGVYYYFSRTTPKQEATNETSPIQSEKVQTIKRRPQTAPTEKGSKRRLPSEAELPAKKQERPETVKKPEVVVKRKPATPKETTDPPQQPSQPQCEEKKNPSAVVVPKKTEEKAVSKPKVEEKQKSKLVEEKAQPQVVPEQSLKEEEVMTQSSGDVIPQEEEEIVVVSYSGQEDGDNPFENDKSEDSVAQERTKKPAAIVVPKKEATVQKQPEPASSPTSWGKPVATIVKTGKLRFANIYCHDLINTDNFSAGDPYLNIDCEATGYHQKTDCKSGHDPKYKESFEVPVVNPDHEITFTILDWDEFSEDDLVGQCKKKASWFRTNIENHEVKLKLKPKGTLHFAVTWFPDAQ